MKVNVKWATLAMILVLVYMRWSQSRREGLCPAAAAMTEQAIKEGCDRLGGQVTDGKCVCADGSPAQ